MSRIQVQLWYHRFKEGRDDVHKDAYPGRPSTLTTDEIFKAVMKIIFNNRRLLERRLMMLAYHLSPAKQFLRI